MKHYITLDGAIKQELKQHPDLKEDFKKELLINKKLKRCILDNPDLSIKFRKDILNAKDEDALL